MFVPPCKRGKTAQTQIAVQSLDESNDSYYGNMRTKIYSRKGCSSSKPRTDRIIYFSKEEDAINKGYRACLKCFPEKSVLEKRRELLGEICDYIRMHYEENLTLDELAVKFGISPFRIQRIFMKGIGITPRKYVDEYRINRVKNKLSDGSPVADAIRSVGRSSNNWLYRGKSTKLGMTPASYRRGGAGEKIDFAIGDTFIGKILVAFTEAGICAVSAADTKDDLVSSLKKEFPNAEISEGVDKESYIDRIVRFLHGEKVDFPLDIRGTGFQKKVWTAMMQIPYGKTASYSEIAEGIGNPDASRAVANACAGNPIPLIIPCHRVIRKGGELGGYGLGIHRKVKLLELEKEISESDSE